ncbi:hypothetical protein ACFXP3_14000 [Streptomyces sp. NPDC059096]|uniref:hypothetical protein n=1 Tax=Streptomyces sp. NPDC059096 TaxID=3346727 RepID=UPI0036CCDAB9
MNELSFRAVPGPGFAAGCTVSTWFSLRGKSAVVAYILIGHPAPRRISETVEEIETSLMGMVSAMGLRPAAERVPAIGDRLIVRGRVVGLDYGHPSFCMRLPDTGDQWRKHVAAGWPTCLTIGLDPIPSGLDSAAVDLYLDRVIAGGRAYMGATAVRGS